ncbi:MAG: hypothetical protein IT480_18335 [Gammaproteobacteria bacterium]|nr:hypothetical protein [Gammaproteobacteria bacterium]
MKSLILLTSLSLAAVPTLAAEAAHEHEHDTQGTTLQLDNGRKWQTDAPLRSSMAEIRQSMAASLEAIHGNTLNEAGYATLAKQVEGKVHTIVAECKLPPAADAQLHVIVGELLVGAGQMAGKSAQGARRDGAVRVIGALANYGQYFDDPKFVPIVH